MILYRFEIKVLLKVLLLWFNVLQTAQTCGPAYLVWIYLFQLSRYFLALILLTGCITFQQHIRAYC